MDEYFFHRSVFQITRPVIRPVTRHIFRYSFQSLKGIDPPYLLLANHNTDFDPVFLGLASEHQIYFVATEKILRMGLLTPFVVRFFDPIIHFKGKAGISSVKEILSRLREKKNVALFPEGNRSFNGLTGDFPAATGKMARRSGATLITYRLHGGYFTSPRWGKGLRRGAVRGEIANIYSPEQLKSMTENQVNEAIQRDLFVDAYADQEKEQIPFSGKQLAAGLESTLFACPRCRKISTLKSTGDRISCTRCGYHADLDVYGYLHDEKGQKSTITQLDSAQKKIIHSLADQAKNDLLFEDTVLAESIGTDHKVLSKWKTVLRAWHDGLSIGNLFLSFQQITGMAINQRNLLIIHSSEGDRHLELSGNLSFSALKYLYLYQYVRQA